MNAYPIGNDLIIKWSLLYSDGSIFPLADFDYELSYRTNRGNKVVSDTSVISVVDNLLTWRLKGEDQFASGAYTLCLKVTFSGSKVAEFQYDNAFVLSPLVSIHGSIAEVCIQSICDAIGIGGAGGDGSSHIEASIYFVSDPGGRGEIEHADQIIIKCEPGAIKTSDEAVFGHYVNNRMRAGDDIKSYTRARYHGWVIPREEHTLPLSMTYLGRDACGFDRWMVTTNALGATSFPEYERLRDLESEQMEEEVRPRLPISTLKKSGIAIYRNGERISDWLKFRVVRDMGIDEEFRLARW